MLDALSYALAEIDHPVIDDLALASVVPAPDGSRVLVTLVPTREDLAADADAALLALRHVADDLRAEVAAEVTRKRVPVLVFRIGTYHDLLQ